MKVYDLLAGAASLSVFDWDCECGSVAALVETLDGFCRADRFEGRASRRRQGVRKRRRGGGL